MLEYSKIERSKEKIKKAAHTKMEIKWSHASLRDEEITKMI